MNETQQLQLDFRTGFPTAIQGQETSEALRSACCAINAQRTRGIQEAAKHTPSSESIPPDVWTATFAEQANQWDVPLVDLDRLGISHDDDGFLLSSELLPLPSGAEAHPYLDVENGIVYKLFDLKPNGSVGKKLVYSSQIEVGFEIETRDAVWLDTLEKLSVLNAAGAHITEIVGLATTGDYIIAKQPLAQPLHDFLTDRETAEEYLKSVVPIGEGLRQRIIVSYVNDQAWLIGDLHERNVMTDANGNPTIIDALIGAITPLALKQLPWLRLACDQAKIYRETGIKPSNNPFESINDDDL